MNWERSYDSWKTREGSFADPYHHSFAEDTECPRCHGDEVIECNECDGKGELEDADTHEKYECPKCHGEKVIDCPRCNP